MSILQPRGNDLVEIAKQTKGLSPTAQKQAASAAARAKAQAERVDNLLAQLDANAGALESARLGLAKEEERLASLRSRLGGDAEEATQSLLADAVRAFDLTTGFRLVDLENIARVETLARHRRRLLVLAEEEWVGSAKAAVEQLEARQRELEAALADDESK